MTRVRHERESVHLRQVANERAFLHRARVIWQISGERIDEQYSHRVRGDGDAKDTRV